MKNCGRALDVMSTRAADLRRARKVSVTHGLAAEVEGAREVIYAESLAFEPRLQDTTWAEYGYLSAFERTELFTRCYVEEFRRKYAEHFDGVRAKDTKPVDPIFIKNLPAAMTGLWHARQQADLLGVTYPLFIRTSMELAIQKWVNKRVPLPNQLCRESQLSAVRQKWKTETQARTFMPSTEWDKRFRAENFRGDQAQVTCLDVIERDVISANHTMQVSRLKSYLMSKKLINEAECRRRFGDELVAHAMAGSDSVVIVLEPSDVRPYRPTCFGLVDKQEARGCLTCQFAKACGYLGQFSKARLKLRLGTENPKADKIRTDTAARVRRFRDRKRAQASEPVH